MWVPSPLTGRITVIDPQSGSIVEFIDPGLGATYPVVVGEYLAIVAHADGVVAVYRADDLSWVGSVQIEADIAEASSDVIRQVNDNADDVSSWIFDGSAVYPGTRLGIGVALTAGTLLVTAFDDRSGMDLVVIDVPTVAVTDRLPSVGAPHPLVGDRLALVLAQGGDPVLVGCAGSKNVRTESAPSVIQAKDWMP